MKKFKILCLMITLSIMMLSFGCEKKKEVSKEPFNIGLSEWVGIAPFFLAKEKGFLGDMKLEFHFVAKEEEKKEGLNSGKYQMICTGLDMFQMKREKEDYTGRIIFTLNESSGADGVVVSGDIKGIQDLKGRKVAGETGSSAYFMLLHLMDKKDMTLKNINFQELSSKEAADAFTAGKVDALAASEPYLSASEKKRNGARLLASSDELPGQLLQVAVVREKGMSKRREDIRRIYEGWCRALDYFAQNPDESIKIMAGAFKMKPEEFSKRISGIKYWGDSENKDYFGTQNSPGEAFENFYSVGLMLQENNLTKIKAPASAKINLSIINPKK